MLLENVIEFSTKKKFETKSQSGFFQSPTPSINFGDLSAPDPKTGLKFNGYIPMCCSLFSPTFLGALSHGEIKLFLYMTFLAWRYPQKGGVRAALPYLASGISESRTSVYRYLQRLETLKLIECIETNFKIGNLYRISDILLWNDTKTLDLPSQDTPTDESKPPESSNQNSENESHQYQIEHAQIETAQNDTAAVPNLDGSNIKTEREQSKIGTEDYSSLFFSNLSYSPSEKKERAQKYVANYLSSIKAPQKRFGEEKLYSKLQKDYTVEKLAGSLEHVQKHGILETGATCHSPMAYLSKAIDGVLHAISSKDAANSTSPRNENLADVTRKQMTEAAQQTELKSINQEIAFEKAFPNPIDRQKYIEGFAKLHPKLKPNGPLVRSHAIEAWARQHLLGLEPMEAQ